MRKDLAEVEFMRSRPTRRTGSSPDGRGTAGGRTEADVAGEVTSGSSPRVTSTPVSIVAGPNSARRTTTRASA
jgi:hypothetical protein